MQVVSCSHHGQRLLPVQHTVNAADDLSHVVVGDFAGPAGADAFGTIHQHSGDDGHVPLWLYTLVIIIVVLEQVVIHGWENQAGEWAEGMKGWNNLLIWANVRAFTVFVSLKIIMTHVTLNFFFKFIFKFFFPSNSCIERQITVPLKVFIHLSQ